MSRLILVEGPPGSGKTTAARRLAQRLQESGRPVRLYVEGDPNPADPAWQWLLTPEQHQALVASLDLAAARELDRWTTASADGVAIAYTKLGSALADRLTGDLARNEPYRGALDGAGFRDLLLRRWARFAGEEVTRPGFVILECALIQNPVTELLLFADWSEAAISAVVEALLQAVDVLDPALVLLRTPHIEDILEAVAAERADGGWREAAEAYVANSPVGARRSWRLIDYLRWRAAFTDRLMPRLAVDQVVLTSRPDPASWRRLSRELDQAADRWLR